VLSARAGPAVGVGAALVFVAAGEAPGVEETAVVEVAAGETACVAAAVEVGTSAAAGVEASGGVRVFLPSHAVTLHASSAMTNSSPAGR
jgi:hypothetical protein